MPIFYHTFCTELFMNTRFTYQSLRIMSYRMLIFESFCFCFLSSGA